MEGYENAEKAGTVAKYWAENAIDTVELAIEFLKQGWVRAYRREGSCVRQMLWD